MGFQKHIWCLQKSARACHTVFDVLKAKWSRQQNTEIFISPTVQRTIRLFFYQCAVSQKIFQVWLIIFRRVRCWLYKAFTWDVCLLGEVEANYVIQCNNHVINIECLIFLTVAERYCSSSLLIFGWWFVLLFCWIAFIYSHCAHPL